MCIGGIGAPPEPCHDAFWLAYVFRASNEFDEKSAEKRPADWTFITDEANWNSVVNLQPLNESLNRSKQDQSLDDWVAEKKIDRASYLLPANVGLDIGSFKPFIEARRVLLAKRLREVVGADTA